MGDRDVVLANYMLASIQKDLGFLKDNRFLSDQTYKDIIALLPSQVQSEAATTTTTTTNYKPPLPTRKSAGVSPRLAPVAAPRENSIPKLPARRSNNNVSQEPPKPAPRSPAVHLSPPKQASAAPAPAPAPPPPPPAYTPQPEPLATVEALYDYDGDDPTTDLSFRRGDIIKVTEYVNGDWWRGELNGKTGIFPQNHVQKITTPAKERAATSAAANNNNNNTLPPYSYPPPPTTMYYSPAPPQQPPIQQYAAPPPAPAQAPAQAAAEGGEHEQGKVQSMAKKFGGHVATAAAFGFGATIGSEAAHALF